MTPSFYVYLHARPSVINAAGIFYVGKGQRDRLRDFSHRTAHHKNIVRKHGQERIVLGRLDCSSEAIAMDLERGLIRRLRAMGVELANYTDGGEGLSGHRHTDETKAKMRASRLGYVMPDSAKDKIRAARLQQPNPWLGRTHSEETKAKLSTRRKGQPNPSARRPCAGITRMKISATKLAKPIVKCPTCEVTGRSGGAMARYHFENCKHKEAHHAPLA